MADDPFYHRLLTASGLVLFAVLAFIVLVNGSVVAPAKVEGRPQRTSAERVARIRKAGAPEPPSNPIIEPDHTIVGRWDSHAFDFYSQALQFHADGTFDLWQHTCVNAYDDYPIHGRYLFDGTEVRLGVEEQLRRYVWTHAWSLWKHDGETFLVPKAYLPEIDLNDPTLPSRLLYHAGEWDDAKVMAFREEFWNRYLDVVPANACYPENVERTEHHD